MGDLVDVDAAVVSFLLVVAVPALEGEGRRRKRKGREKKEVGKTWMSPSPQSVRSGGPGRLGWLMALWGPWGPNTSMGWAAPAMEK